jgi:hypothetical protein
MPSARIITRSAEQSHELAAKLRARGYTVEMVSPQQVPDTAADVEITLEECTPEEALIKAGLVFDVKDFDVKDLCVFIAPGAIAEPSPIAEIPLIAPAEQHSARREAAPLESLSGSSSSQARPIMNSEAPARCENISREAKQAPASVPRPNNASEVYVYQDAVLSPLQRLRLPRLRLPRLRLPHISLELPRPSFRLPHWSLPRFPRPRLSFRLPAPKLRLPQLSLRLPSWSLHVPRVKFRIPRFILDLPQFAFKRRPSAIPVTPVPARDPRLWLRLDRPRSSAVFWDSAVAFGILAVSVLLVVGLVQRPSPMPADIVERSQRTEQQVPFGAVKPISRAVPPQVVPAPAKGAGPAVKAPQVAVQKEKLPPKAEIAKPAPAVSKSALTPRAKAAPTVRRGRSSSAEAGYVAEDVVVHYGKKPSPHSGQAPVVRSDLN